MRKIIAGVLLLLLAVLTGILILVVPTKVFIQAIFPMLSFLFCLAISVTVIAVTVFYKGARLNKQATFVEEGTIKFLIKGHDFWKLIMNVKDHVYNHDTDT